MTGSVDHICVYHGRRYATRSPLCETADCPNIGNNTSKEWGNDGKHIAHVLRCDDCYPIAQEMVREMEAREEAKSDREKARKTIRQKAMELGAALLTQTEREVAGL